jgi:hypothetical protein
VLHSFPTRRSSDLWYLPSKKAGFKGWVREDAIKLSK